MQRDGKQIQSAFEEDDNLTKLAYVVLPNTGAGHSTCGADTSRQTRNWKEGDQNFSCLY